MDKKLKLVLLITSIILAIIIAVFVGKQVYDDFQVEPQPYIPGFLKPK